MNTDLMEDEMRQALFGAAPAPAQPLPVSAPATPVPDVVIAAPSAAKKKASKAFTPRLRVTLQVGNIFEGDTQLYVHEADTLSTLLAEQEAVKAARKKYRYIEVVSVKSM